MICISDDAIVTGLEAANRQVRIRLHVDTGKGDIVSETNRTNPEKIPNACEKKPAMIEG